MFTSEMPTSYAARIQPVIDRVYVALRRAGGPRVRAVVERRGVDRAAVGVLNDIYFAILARPIADDGLAAVERYADPRELAASVETTIDAGLIARDGAGRIELTSAGRALLLDMQDAIAEAAAALWGPAGRVIPQLNGVLTRLLAAGTATGGEAFAVMAPPYEADGASAAVLFCNRLGALRHHRADAHAAAWAANGLTAAGMLTLNDARLRETIEDETNRRDAPIYAALSEDERRDLLAGLGLLAG